MCILLNILYPGYEVSRQHNHHRYAVIWDIKKHEGLKCLVHFWFKSDEYLSTIHPPILHVDFTSDIDCVVS
jgi:hypothetical protein